VVDPDLPSDFDPTQGNSRNVRPASNVDPINSTFPHERRRTYDGDGAMVGRVLVYAATIIFIVVVVVIWKHLA
jgi:hypothetical protein